MPHSLPPLTAMLLYVVRTHILYSTNARFDIIWLAELAEPDQTTIFTIANSTSPEHGFEEKLEPGKIGTGDRTGNLIATAW